jgi:transcriptional regulator with XRE-family HTH domain
MKGRLMATPKTASSESLDKKEMVLTKAVLRSARLLGVSRKEIAEIIGVSEPTLSRMHQGEATIVLKSKEGEAASLWLRVYRSLDSLLGGKPELCSKWLTAPNEHLGGVPLNLSKKIQGLVHVAGYLDAMRAKT